MNPEAWAALAAVLLLGAVSPGPSLFAGGAAIRCAVAVHAPAGRIAFVQGFAVALLNPKILAWLLALYAPFIKAQMEIGTLLRMSLLGMMTDGTWYVTVRLCCPARVRWTGSGPRDTFLISRWVC